MAKHNCFLNQKQIHSTRNQIKEKVEKTIKMAQLAHDPLIVYFNHFD